MRSAIAWMICSSVLQETREKWELQGYYLGLAGVIPERGCLTEQECSSCLCVFISIRPAALFGKNKQTKHNAKLQNESILQAPSLKPCPVLQFYHFMEVTTSAYRFVLMSFNHHSCSTTADAGGELLNNHWCLCLHVCQSGTVCIHAFIHAAFLSFSAALLHESRYVATALPEQENTEVCGAQSVCVSCMYRYFPAWFIPPMFSS